MPKAKPKHFPATQVRWDEGIHAGLEKVGERMQVEPAVVVRRIVYMSMNLWLPTYWALLLELSTFCGNEAQRSQPDGAFLWACHTARGAFNELERRKGRKLTEEETTERLVAALDQLRPQWQASLADPEVEYTTPTAERLVELVAATA